MKLTAPRQTIHTFGSSLVSFAILYRLIYVNLHVYNTYIRICMIFHTHIYTWTDILRQISGIYIYIAYIYIRIEAKRLSSVYMHVHKTES